MARTEALARAKAASQPRHRACAQGTTVRLDWPRKMNRPKYPESDIEILLGDRVQFADGDFGSVVFIISTDEWREDFANGKEWYEKEFGQGVMIETDAHHLALVSETDNELLFVQREEDSKGQRVAGCD